jgi:hypothetical protein
MSGWLFFVLIVHWLGVAAYRGLEFERIYQSLLIFSPSIFGAAAAYVLTPTLPVEGEIDLDKHYFSVAPWVLRLAAAFLALAGLSDLLVPGEEPAPLLVYLSLATALLLLSLTARPLVHRVALLVLIAMLLRTVALGLVARAVRPSTRLQLTPSSSFQGTRGSILAAGAVPQR